MAKSFAILAPTLLARAQNVVQQRSQQRLYRSFDYGGEFRRAFTRWAVTSFAVCVEGWGGGKSATGSRLLESRDMCGRTKSTLAGGVYWH